MGYLFGDSTESGLEFNYLAFLREAVDCAVALVECDLALASIAERRRVRDGETDAELSAVIELGRRATDLVNPIARDQKDVAVGRCAAAITTAIREAVEREATHVRGKLAEQRSALDKESQAVGTRAREAIERLLRTHDLPTAETELDVACTTSGCTATLKQRTRFGVEAVVALDIPPASVFTPDLRAEQLAPGVEVHVREAGGWIKKADKLVAHKLGRYHVAAISIGANTRIQLRSDTGAGEITIIATPNGDLVVDGSGGGSAREIVVEDRDRAGLRTFVEKVEAATRALAVSRGRLVSIELGKQAVGEDGTARLLAERMMSAMAPTVHKIKAHSRNDEELVLRRLLGDNRREETYVPIAELVKQFEGLPVPAQSVFAPLQLRGEPAMPIEIEPVAVETKPVDKASVESKPSEPKPPAVKVPLVPMPDRTGSRTSPPVERAGSGTSPPTTTMAEPPPPRTKEPTQPFGTPVTERVAVAPPAPPAPELDDDEWPAISRDESNDKPVSSS